MKMTIQEVNRLGSEEFVSHLGSALEDSPWVADGAWDSRPFRSVDDLHAAMVRMVEEASDERRMALLRAHPDLAGKAAIKGELTPESEGEQASAGLDRLTPEEYDAFTRMNAAYREKFRFPMIVCVREHTKESILRNAEGRLDNTPEEEVETALGEVYKIARLRLRDLVEDGGAEDVEGERETMSDTTGEGAASAKKVVLGHNSYGKSEIRLVKVDRATERHGLWDLYVSVTLEGDFDAAHVNGDNTGLLATDTMRNTVYALAKDRLTGSIEDFGLSLVEHFLDAGPSVEKATVRITSFPWDRIEVDGKPHEHSFVRGAGERKATLIGDVDGSRRVEAGIDNLLVMKTTQSGFEGFLRDRFTTLPETGDRILATAVTATWTYGGTSGPDFDPLWNEIRGQILSSFTDHYSPSVQNTLYRIGKAVLEAYPEVEKIHLSFPNKHHIPYDLARFGIENENEIFHATSEPYGLIEGTVEREA